MADTDLLDDLEVLDTEAETAEDQPTEETTVTEETAEETEGRLPPPTTLFQPDGKKLDPAIKQVLAEAKAKSPDAAKLIARSLYDHAAVLREFPGGLEEAKEMRDRIDALGGTAAIEENLQALQEFSEIDTEFKQGQPAFVSRMIENNPESFLKIAPVVFGKYAELHPDGFKQYLGRVIYNDFIESRLYGQLDSMAASIRLKDESGIVSAYNAIRGYLDSYEGLAKSKPQAPHFDRPEPSREENYSKREDELRAKEWGIEHSRIDRGIYDSEYRAIVGNRKVTSEEAAEIQERFNIQRKLLGKKYFPTAQDKLARLRSTNDKAGFMRLATQMHRKVTPEALRYAVNRTLKTQPARTTAQPTQPAQRQQPQRPANGQPAGGFKFVANEPDTWAIDYSYPGIQGMLLQNRAVLTNGDKVQWREKK